MRKQEEGGRSLPERIPDWLEELSVLAGVACVGAVLFTLIGCGEYPERLADNKYLMLLVLVFFLGAGSLYMVSYRKVLRRKALTEDNSRAKIFRHPAWRLAAGYLVLYLLQLFWVNRVYFYTSWDAGLLKYRVDWVVNGGSMAELSIDVGYSIYPNNLLLFYAFCLIEKLGMLFSMAEPYNLCIYLSCLCVNLSCFLGSLILWKFTKSGVMKCCYMLISTAAILFSPWIIIPYSDTYGMLFVLLGMWGLLCVDRKYLKWVVVAFAAMIGYLVKPTCIFPLFVAYLVYGVRYLCSLREHWRELCVLILSTMLFAGMWQLVPLWIQHTYSFRLLPECRITYTHYLMMGINAETKGAYNFEDFQYSNHFPDVESRQQANRDEFVHRLEALIAEKKLGNFLKDKALVNFNDGTFAWVQEGAFFAGRIEHDSVLWDWFRSWMVPPEVWESDGKYYRLYRTIMQFFWLLMLTGILFTAVDRKQYRTRKACAMIALCGLMVFVMIFEARARYLYLYSPVFLILALWGYEAVWQKAAGVIFAGRELSPNEPAA